MLNPLSMLVIIVAILVATLVILTIAVCIIMITCTNKICRRIWYMTQRFQSDIATLIARADNGDKGKKLAVSAVLMLLPAINAKGQGPQVYTVDSLTRVGQNDALPPVMGPAAINLTGARGETVDTQVIVRAPLGGLTNVNITSTLLLPATITIYREYYVSVNGTMAQGGLPSGGTNLPLGAGSYPEPLIPFNDPETGISLCNTTAVLKACNAIVNAGQNQPYWIDINILRGALAPPGTYNGTITVTSTQGNVTIPLSLTVWNFELPLKPTELSEWTLWNPNTGNTNHSLALALMRNKVMSRYDDVASIGVDINNFGVNRMGLDGSYYIGATCSGSSSSLPTTAQLASAASLFPIGVYNLPFDIYAGDEIQLPSCPGAIPTLKTLAINAHNANVKVSLTTNTPYSGLYGFIDNWILLDSIQLWPSLPFTGGNLWSYTSCNIGSGNTPEWLIDYPLINERIQAGFLNWIEGATGILYYRADGWLSGNSISSWNSLDNAACGTGSNNPGDGIFIYPPGPIGSTESAPGMRLKAIRDGIQDYEYARLLGAGAAAILQPVATSWTSWSKSAATLEAARMAIGQQLSGPVTTPPSSHTLTCTGITLPVITPSTITCTIQ